MFDIENFTISRKEYNDTANNIVITKHFYKTDESENIITSENYFHKLISYKTVILGDIISIYYTTSNKIINYYINNLTKDLISIAPTLTKENNGVLSINGDSNQVVFLTKNDLGLGNVTNSHQIPLSEKGYSVATLDQNQKIPVEQMPFFDLPYPNIAFSQTLSRTNQLNLLFFGISTENFPFDGHIPLGIVNFRNGIIFAIGYSSNIPIGGGRINVYIKINNTIHNDTGEFLQIDAPIQNNVFILQKPVVFVADDTVNAFAIFQNVASGGLIEITLWKKLNF